MAAALYLLPLPFVLLLYTIFSDLERLAVIYFRISETVSFIFSGLHCLSWRIAAASRSRIAAGTGTPDTRSISGISENSSAAPFSVPETASITLFKNLYGLAVEAITVFVLSPVSSAYFLYTQDATPVCVSIR